MNTNVKNHYIGLMTVLGLMGQPEGPLVGEAEN